jgi:hypothetical protein
MRKQEGASFGGEAILLEAAVGLVGEGHFDVSQFEKALDLFFQFTRNAVMADCPGDCHFAERLVFERVDQRSGEL